MDPVHSRPRRIRSDRGCLNGEVLFGNSCDDNVVDG